VAAGRVVKGVRFADLRDAGDPVELAGRYDADGTREGFDLELVRLVRAAVDVPLIASGGAGAAAHVPPVVDAGADAGLAASIFHFGQVTIGEVKQALAGAGHPVRLARPRQD
jgi:cyclase